MFVCSRVVLESYIESDGKAYCADCGSALSSGDPTRYLLWIVFILVLLLTHSLPLFSAIAGRGDIIHSVVVENNRDPQLSESQEELVASSAVLATTTDIVISIAPASQQMLAAGTSLDVVSHGSNDHPPKANPMRIDNPLKRSQEIPIIRIEPPTPTTTR